MCFRESGGCSYSYRTERAKLTRSLPNQSTSYIISMLKLLFFSLYISTNTTQCLVMILCWAYGSNTLKRSAAIFFIITPGFEVKDYCFGCCVAVAGCCCWLLVAGCCCCCCCCCCLLFAVAEWKNKGWCDTWRTDACEQTTQVEAPMTQAKTLSLCCFFLANLKNSPKTMHWR